MSYLKDREIWLSSVPTGNPPAGYVWVFIQNGVFVVRDSNGVDKIMATTTGTVTNATSASYVEYSNVANKPALISGSSQVSFNGITDKPALVSSSAQIVGYNVFATTGSNTFQNNQVITGSLFITQNLVVAGSSSIQYISSSVLDIADNTITVNTFNPSVRFGGLGVIDSGSSPQVSGSILFDSVKDQWIFVHQNQSVVTSSVLLMGPETYNDLGNESYISANRLPKGSGVEHLRDSNISDTGTVVSINSNTAVTGSFTVVTGSAVELQVTNTGVNIGSALTDSHIISGSLRVNPNGLFVSGSGAVGIGTTSPNGKLRIQNDNSTVPSLIVRDGGTPTANLIEATSNAYGDSFILSATGIATFKGQTIAANGSVNIESADPAIRFRYTGGTANSRIYEWRAVAAGGVNDIMQLRLWNDAQSSASTLFTVSPTGAGIFSSHITGTCTTSFNGDGIRVVASATGAGGSQPGIGYWTAAGSKRFINQLDVSSDTWAVTGATGTNYLLITQTGLSTFSSGVAGYGITLNHTSENLRLRMGAVAGGIVNIQGEVISSGGAYSIVLNNAGGNVGIGVNPQDRLDVNGSIRFRANTPNFTAVTDNAVLDYVPTSIFATDPCIRLAAIGTASIGAEIRFLTGTSITLSERMRIISSGAVGVGVTPKNYASTWAAVQVGNLALMGPNPSADPNAIIGANAYRASDETWKRIRGGYANLIELNQGNGDIRTYTSGTSTAESTISFVNGPFVANGGVSWTNGSSDVRKKKNFEPSQGLAEVLQIEPVKYHFNWDKDEDKKRLGFKAQNILELIPEMVSETGELAEDGTSYLTLTPDYLLPVLVKAIQELKSENDNLKSRLEVLEQS
jgi:hypothetical protein